MITYTFSGTHVEGGAIHSHDGDLAGGPSPSGHYRKWLLELPGMECEGAQSSAHEQTTSLHDQHAEHPRELVELVRDPAAVVRFKSLKTSDEENS